MGSNIGKNVQLIDTVVRAVKEVARKPVWVKLTPTTTNIAKEAEAAFKAGADAISSSNTFTSLPPIDPESLEFECNVDGKVSYGGLGGPAILPLSLAKMAQMTTAFPARSFSGIGGISDFSQALNYFLLGCGTAQVCTAAMLDHAIGPTVIKELLSGMQAFFDKHADQGWHSLDDIRGLRRNRIVAHSDIRRPDAKEYHGGRDAPEGYATPTASA
jgi:dihydroorotate dehydrogenase